VQLVRTVTNWPSTTNEVSSFLYDGGGALVVWDSTDRTTATYDDIEPNDATDLAEKLSILLDSAELRMAMGNAGRRRFLAEYEWDVVIDRYRQPLFEMGTKASSYRLQISAAKRHADSCHYL
jgi:glycosyltransferase involved in cell wall biosynthesis